MAKTFNQRARTVSQQIYEHLLWAYPKAHRNEYGAAMAQLFRDQSRDAWNAGRGWGLAKLWLRTLPDLVNTSIAERIAALNPRKYMSDKVTALFRPLTTPTSVFFTVFIVVFLIVFLSSVAITFLLPESYASTARIVVEPPANTSFFPSQSAYDPYFIQTTFEILQSQVVLDPVIDQLKLDDKWGKKYFAGQTLKSSESLQILKGRLSLAPVRNTKLIRITVYSDDRNEAAQIANAIVESYRVYRYKSRDEMFAKAIAVLQQQYNLEEARIQKAQSDLEAHRRTLAIEHDATASQAPKEQPYWDKQRDLQQLLEVHKLLYSKIEAERLDAQIPKASLVDFIEKAQPGRMPVKPNKPLNIFIGALAGGFLGLVVGGASATISSKRGNRGRKDIAAA